MFFLPQMKYTYFLFNHRVKMRTIFMVILSIFLVSCVRHKISLGQKLRSEGVRIIHVGETIRLVLSSDVLFMPESANIQDCQYPVLNDIAKFLRRYQKVVVIVAAYKNPSGDPHYDQALTRQQASNVVTYLWNQDIDARMIEGIGFGGKCRLSSQCALNQRLEIVFHYIPDYLHEMNNSK